MCGIAGFSIAPGLSAAERLARHGRALQEMTASLRHRGPDAQTGLLLDGVALGHTRLAILDLAGGAQPMTDPETGVTVVFNGEIFNHRELRARLADRYRFRTRCDTEVLLAAFLARGIDCAREFNGQFAFAVWDPRERALWLARDPVGIAPLFFALSDGQIAFASEAKAIFAAGFLEPRLDPRALKQTLQLWSPVPGRSAFEGVQALLPGAVACWCAGELRQWRYWDLDLGEERVDRSITLEQASARLGEALAEAVRIRLQADVPVGAYLSGGLDSSLVSALAQRELKGSLRTFSICFADAGYDERGYQLAAARALATEHKASEIPVADLGELLPAAVEHAELPLFRTAPAPLFSLSRRVREDGVRVVLTGEGADEMLLGYDVFKETKVRQFWARDPGSRLRPLLLHRLHPSLGVGEQPLDLLRSLYGAGLEPERPEFSHAVRWAQSGRIARFYSREFAQRTAGEDPVASLVALLPERVRGWKALARAQYIEVHTLLSGYLLSTQGDRMLLGHGVEGRFPYLDPHVIELASRLPARLKLRGLREKHVLKQFARSRVPQEIVARHKFPYRAPAAAVLSGAQAPRWAQELLQPEAIRRHGVFDERKVAALLAKLRGRAGPVSEADAAAVVAVATTQLLAERFARPPTRTAAEREAVALEAR